MTLQDAAGTRAADQRAVPFFDVRLLHARAGLQERIDEAVLRVARSGRYLFGRELGGFEADFAAYCGARHCVASGTGLAAIELALRAVGIGPGDEVLVPSHTFIATWLAVSATGARPVPVEPVLGGYLIDPDRIEASVTPRTRAVVPVHLYGHPVDLDAVQAVADRHGLVVVEDAAQAHGARYRGRRIGSGHLAAFSFYPAKNLGAIGDGGGVVTDDDGIAERVRLLRDYGSREKYHHEMRGTNSRLDEIQAAVLRLKLPYLDQWNERRRQIAARYTEALTGLPSLRLPSVAPWAEHAWHQYVLRSPRRDSVQARLTAAGIQTLVHYPVAPHRSVAYANEVGDASLPEAERLAAEVFSLPIGPYLEDDEVEAVVEEVRRAVEEVG